MAILDEFIWQQHIAFPLNNSLSLQQKMNNLIHSLTQRKQINTFKPQEYQNSWVQNKENYLQLYTQTEFVNRQLRQQRVQNQRLINQIKDLHSIVQQTDIKNRQLSKKLAQFEQHKKRQKNDCSPTTKQIDRLNIVITNKIASNQHAKFVRLAQENQLFSQLVTSIQKETCELKLARDKMLKLQQHNEALRKHADNERLKIEQQSFRINQLGSALHHANQSYMSLQPQNASLQHTLRQENSKSNHLQERISYLSLKCNEYQAVINELTNQMQRLNDILHSKSQRIYFLQNQRQKQIIRGNQDPQLTHCSLTPLLNLDQSFSSLNRGRFLDDYSRKSHFCVDQDIYLQISRAKMENAHLIDQLDQYRNKTKQMFQELERLQIILSSSKQQNENLKKQIGKLNKPLIVSLKDKCQAYQQEIGKLSQILIQQNSIKQLRQFYKQGGPY